MAHISVLLDETIELLIPQGRQVERAVDGTLGAGGHTRALLDAGATSVLAFDLDPQAIALARANLAPYGERVEILQASYLTMQDAAVQHGWSDGVDAILLDLGVSSMQLDTPERGFAFMHEGPLDMRFNPQSGDLTAADIVNTWDEGELADLFWKYGEERDSRRIARAIAAARPFSTTQQLADAIKTTTIANDYKRRRKGEKVKTAHPATQVFQALRIAVNDELRTVERVVPMAINLLRPGGRFAVITFHSLEDRIVKTLFKDASSEILSPPGMQLEEKYATVRLVTRKPVTAGADEIAANPRSRSAKLRAVEKL